VEALADPIGLEMRIVIRVWSMFSTASNSSYSYRSGGAAVFGAALDEDPVHENLLLLEK